MNQLLLIVLVLASVSGKMNISKSQLILNFLKKTNTKICIFLLCCREYEIVNLQRLIQSELTIFTHYPRIYDGVIKNIKDEKYVKVSYVMDLSCERSHEVLEEVSEAGKFRFTHTWLLLHNSTMANDDIKALFSGLKLRADMNVKIALPNSEQTEYDIFEIYKLGLAMDIVIKRMDDRTFEYPSEQLSFYEARKNMSGVLIRSGHTEQYHFEVDAEYQQARRYKEIGTFGKYHFELFRILQQVHNFHYNTTLRYAWFGNTSGGGDGGVASLLYRKEVDVMSSGGALRYARVDYYDYLVPYFPFRTCFFFRNPGTVELGAEVLKPFSARTWYATIGTVILMGTTIKFAYWVEHRYLNTNAKYSLFTSLVITISILAQQGSAILPNRLGSRIIFLTLLVVSMILYNYYTSSLVSSLLSTKPRMLKTIKELYESNLRVGIEDQPYTTTLIIQQRDDEYIQKLNSTKIYENGRQNILPPDEGVALMKEGGFAYHTEATTAYPLISRSFDQNMICDLAEIIFYPPSPFGMLLQKHSEYTVLFQTSMMKMRERGLFKRELDIWASKKPACLLSSQLVSVGVNELFIVYLILFVGIFSSTLILIIEIISFRVENRNIVGDFTF